MSATAMTTPPARKILIYRHSVLVRITHWINAICIIFLILSGLQIFNAHPALYIGQKSTFDTPVFSMTSRVDSSGQRIGETYIFGKPFNTTGVFGYSTSAAGPEVRGFPAWATIPTYRDLATGRHWHFFFAWIFVINGAVYLIASLINRHLWRDMVPSWREVGRIGRSVLDHLRFRFDHGRDYNVLQKLAYLGLVVVVLPVLILAGMTMSPGLDAAFPWLLDIFGGRQTARTIHFICAMLVILFIVVHLVMVLISGVWNNIRSMVTGRYATRGGNADEH